eukprot:10258583-Lingulodinium_polyedra.AAC.1
MSECLAAGKESDREPDTGCRSASGRPVNPTDNPTETSACFWAAGQPDREPDRTWGRQPQHQHQDRQRPQVD